GTKYTVAGAIMVPLGAIMAAGMWALATTCRGFDGGCVVTNLTLWPVLGATTFFTGIGLLGYGATHHTQMDANRPEILDARRSTQLRLAGLGVAPSSTGASAAVQFAF